MAAQKGKDLLLKIKPAGAGVFTTVAGIRSNRISFNSETVDTTHAESIGQWRELLAGAGVRSAGVSGSGIFKDQTADSDIQTAFFNGDILDWQIVIPAFGTIDGLFQISSLEYTGQYNGEMTYEIALESAGALTFTGV